MRISYMRFYPTEAKVVRELFDEGWHGYLIKYDLRTTEVWEPGVQIKENKVWVRGDVIKAKTNFFGAHNVWLPKE